MEVGDHVGDPRRGLAQHLAPAVHVPAGQALGHRDGHEPGAGLAHELEDVGVGRGLHGDPLAPAREEVTDGVDGAHRTGRHHDLLRHGGDSAHGVPLGDHRAQRGQPGRVVAVGVGVRREFLQGALHGPGEPRLGRRERGAAEVDHRTQGLGGQGFQATGGDGVAGRYGGPAAGSAPGLQEALAAQRLVGRGHGGAADGEGEGQFAFRGQARGHRDPALQHEQPDAVGEGAVGGGTAGAGAGRTLLLGVEEPGELRGPHGRGPLRHEDQSTFPELAMDNDSSHATECHASGHRHHPGG